MGFGDALRPTDGATVVLNIDTSQTAKLERAEAQWRDSVGQMSREALKLDLAQDRLKKSLAAYGAESAQAKRATIALKDAEEQATRAADRHAREIREVNRAHTSARVSTRRLIGTVAGLAGAYIGAQGLIQATRTALQASSNLAEQQDFANRMFNRSTWIIQNYARNALGLAQDEAYEAAAGIGSLLVKFTESDEEAAKLSVTLTKLGVDLSSIKNTRVDEALTALKSGLVGETEPLRRYAVLLNAASVEQEAMRMTGKANAKQITEGEKVMARVNIILREATYAQGNYADTIESTANQEREAQKNLRNTAILIGDVLQPAYRELLRRVNDYVGDAEKQREIQEKVNDAVKIGEGIVRGLATAFGIVKEAAKPFVDVLGGVENTVTAMGIAFVAFKLKAVAAFIVTTAASALASRKMVIDATVAGRAWDVATRPRTMVVTTVGTPGPGGGRIPPIVAAGGAAAAVVFAYSAAALVLMRDKSGDPRAAGYVPKGYDRAGMTIFWRPKEKVYTYGLTNDVVPRAVLIAAGIIVVKPVTTGQQSPDSIPGSRGSVGTTPPPKKGGGGAGAGRTIEDILLDQARAQTTATTADDLRYHREAAAYYQRQINALESRKNLTAEQKRSLATLYGQLASEQAAIEAIISDSESKLAAQREAAAQKRAAAAERHMERVRAIAEKQAQRQYDLFEDLGKLDTRKKMREAALRGLKSGDAAKKAADSARPIEPLDPVAFLSSLRGTMNQFGGNLFAPGSLQVAGSPNPELFSMVTELREQTSLLAGLTSSARHPGTRNARTELALAFDGPTF